MYDLKRREKWKNVEETRNSPIPTPIRSLRIHTNLVSSDTEKLQELTDTPHTTSSVYSKKLTKTKSPSIIIKTKPTRSNATRASSRVTSKFLEQVQIKFRVYVAEGDSGRGKRQEMNCLARRANDCIVSITEPDYKNLNKNDIEDIYLLIMNGKVPDYADTGLLWSLSVFIRSSVIWERVHDFQLGIESYQQKVNLTAPTITFPGIEEHEMFSIIYEPVHGIIYKNSKKEKRVMRHSEIHKFCDATLNRVLEGLKSYNNDVKYGYVQKDLTKDETEYLKLFEEEIEERLKHRRQMRRWEMFVNGRPLGSRRERPE
ncbi:hypothetical protein Tco_1466678 [Tanacetum coccineum]